MTNQFIKANATNAGAVQEQRKLARKSESSRDVASVKEKAERKSKGHIKGTADGRDVRAAPVRSCRPPHHTTIRSRPRSEPPPSAHAHGPRPTPDVFKFRSCSCRAQAAPDKELVLYEFVAML
eukprot:1593821-Prymnesium_polylepis.1